MFDAIAVAVEGDADKEELSEESCVKTSVEKGGEQCVTTLEKVMQKCVKECASV
jgi:hypothetical protein